MRCLRCGTENPENANNCQKCNATLRRTCPRCRAVNKQNQIFCGNCGLKLINVCPRCKAHNSPVQKYCGNCGLKIINFCPKCGMNNPIGQRFCGNCATKLLPAQVSKQLSSDSQGVRQPAQTRSGEQRPPQALASPKPSNPQQRIQPKQPPLRSKETIPPQRQKQEESNKPTASEIGRQMRMQQVTPAPVEKSAGQNAPLQQRKPQVQQHPTHAPAQKIQPPQKQQQFKPQLHPEKQSAQQQTVQPAQKLQPRPETTQPPVKHPESPVKQKHVDPVPPALPPENIPQQTEDITEQVQQDIRELRKEQVATGEQASITTNQIKETEIEQITPQHPIIDKTESIAKESIEPEIKDPIEPEIAPTEGPDIIEDNIEILPDLHQPEQFEAEEDFTLDSLAQSMVEEPEEKPSFVELVRFAVLSIEIVNYSSICEKLDTTILNNVKEKLWNIIRNTANSNNEDLVEVAENIGVIPFAHAENKQQSSMTAVRIAGEIFELVKILNSQLENAINTEIKIKIGISFNDAEGVSQLERSIASVWSIVVSEEIKKDTEGICKYDTIGPLPIGNQMVTFYKYNLAESGHNIKIETARTRADSRAAKQQTPEDKASQHLNDDMPSAPPNVEDKEPMPEIETKTLSKDNLVASLINTCNLVDSSDSGEFVGISSEDGLGKSTAIRELKASLSPQSFIWMSTYCNYQDQLIPLSAIRNMFRNFFGIPNIIHNREEAQGIIKPAIEAITGTNEQLCFIMNSLILGEEVSGLTKMHIINAFHAIIRAIAEKATVVILIEDLDAIDNTSFEILEALLETRILDARMVMLATFHNNLSFVESKPHLVSQIKYSQINLAPFAKEEFDNTVTAIIQAPLELPGKLKEQLMSVTQGTPFILEMSLFLMYELGVVGNTDQGPAFNPEASQWEMPPTLQDIIRLRLHRLSQVNPNAFILLQIAAILGPRFSPGLLQDISVQGKQFEENLQFLTSLGYIIIEDQNTASFKHNIIWEIMYYAGMPNESKAQYHMQVVNHLERIQQSGGRMDLAYLAYHAENAGKRRKSLNYWNLVANQVLALGVNTGYSETMMRYINILEQSDIQNKQDLQVNALEGIAKVCHASDPELAIQAFDKVITVREQEDNTAKLIELRGFMAMSYEQLGRWDDAIAQINKSIELINTETMPLERVVLLTSMLSPMECMGKYGWILSTCKNDIFPVIEQAIKSAKIPDGMTEEQLYRIYYSTKITFANALIPAGHHEVFTVFEEIMPEIEKRGFQDLGLKVYICQARWRAIRGEIEFTEKILSQTREFLMQMPGINHLSLSWGEAACYLNLEMGNWDVLTNVVEGVRIQAKKLNHYPLIALTKLCSGLLLQTKNQPDKALEVFNDTINYVSQYKLSSIALMTWYFLAVAEMQAKHFEKAESIAHKALEVAKMPDIYNLSGLITLNRLLGEIYIRKGELEKSGSYLEEAWKVATEVQNHSQVAKVAITIGQMYQELINVSEENKKENAEKAYEFISNALNIFTQLGHQLHCQRAEKALENLEVICKVNSINI